MSNNWKKEVYIDWSKAPKGTTHVICRDLLDYNEAFSSSGVPNNKGRWEKHHNGAVFAYRDNSWKYYVPINVSLCDRISRAENELHSVFCKAKESIRDVVDEHVQEDNKKVRIKEFTDKFESKNADDCTFKVFDEIEGEFFGHTTYVNGYTSPCAWKRFGNSNIGRSADLLPKKPKDYKITLEVFVKGEVNREEIQQLIRKIQNKSMSIKTDVRVDEL